jgi:hypothetical protein
VSLIEHVLRETLQTQGQVQDLETHDVVPVVARYTRDTTQSIPNNTTTIVDFATQVDDPWAAVTTGASWAFTAPVAGYYQVNAHVLFGSATWTPVTELVQLSIYKNGTQYNTLDRDDTMGSTNTPSVGGGDVVHLAKGDTLDIRAYQNSGGAVNIQANANHNWVSIFRI